MPLNGSFGIFDFVAQTYTPLGSTSATYSGLGFDFQHSLYTVEENTGRFFKVNPANGAGTLIGSGTGVRNWVMAALTTGALYEIDLNSNLLRIDPATGAATLLGSIGLPVPNGGAGGLTGTSSILYYTFNDASLPDTKSILYKIDPASCCAAHRIGADTGIDFIGELAMVNGTLYGFDNVGKNVLKIDTTTGVATLRFAFPNALAGDKVVGSADVSDNPGRLLVSAVGGQIIDVNVDGSTGFNLTPFDTGGSQLVSASSVPSVALNGTIAFAANRDGTGNRVFVMNGDATNIHQITFADATGADDRFPAISPDGSMVAFVSSRAAAKNVPVPKIFVVNIDGTGLRQVQPIQFDQSGNIADTDFNVAWSPDSKKLAFRGVRLSTICNSATAAGIVQMTGTVNLDGSNQKVLACNQSPHEDNGLDWSPDGNLIAFTRSYDAGGPVVVAIIDPDGNSKFGLTFTQLGSQTGGERGIHFSPDSSRIAYVNNPPNSNFAGISTINLDGTGRMDSLPFPAPGPLWWAPGPAISTPVQLTLAPDPAQVWPGHKQQLLATLLDASGNVLTHGVQDYFAQTGCASIDAAGLLTLVNPNQTDKIFVKAAGLTSNTVTVECLPLAPVANVSDAGFVGEDLAAESIAAGFGTDLATMRQLASVIPLPTNMAGTHVDVQDSTGTKRAAGLFYVSALQVNYQIPSGTAAGPATITVTSGDGSMSSGTVMITPVAPGFFTADSNGKGVAAAQAVRVAADGTQTPIAVVQCPTSGPCTAVPIDLGSATDQVVLELFGTGIRGRSSLSNVTCTVGSLAAPIGYAGAQSQFVGVDQVNVTLPRGLASAGLVNVALTVDGNPPTSSQSASGSALVRAVFALLRTLA